MQGTILRGIGSFYTVRCADGAEYTLRAQRKLRHARVKPKAGDRVLFEIESGEEQGWITEILPRKNDLERPAVANIDKLVVVASAAAPQPDMLLVDRIIIAARRASIEPVLVVSKAELDPSGAQALLSEYRGADMASLAVSAMTGEGIDALREALLGSTHALAGQSGAGKSTLINALYGLDRETGDLSEKIERGRNTTRSCELIPVAGGGMVLDTPGFSLLETALIDPVELKDSYPEFEPFEGGCYFHPCYHAHEPKCAVLDAVRSGTIDPRRHERYVQILEDMKIRWRERYD